MITFTRIYRIFIPHDKNSFLISAEPKTRHSNKKEIINLPCLSTLPTGALLIKCNRQYNQYLDENNVLGVLCHITSIPKYKKEEFKRDNQCTVCYYPKDHLNTYIMHDDELLKFSCWDCDFSLTSTINILKTNKTIINCAKIPKYFFKTK